MMIKCLAQGHNCRAGIRTGDLRYGSPRSYPLSHNSSSFVGNYYIILWVLLHLWELLQNINNEGPFHKGLRFIPSCLNTQFAIELRLISIVRLIAAICETGPGLCPCTSSLFLLFFS